ncbi:MAG: anhydro-N-acetylmuramic acid kinase [Waterburya sp.]
MKVIGLMSGTSVDGIDAVVVEVNGRETDLQVELLTGATFAYPQELRAKIIGVCGGEALSLEELAILDDAIATQFAAAASQIASQHSAVELIGSHGQTVYHRPPILEKTTKKLGYSLQIGRGELIAHLTGIKTVSNFRAADIALGGEGAPLVPKIDACLLSDPTKTRAIQNLGGIGNVAYLPPNQIPNWKQQVCGWDTGPANALLDLAVTRLTNGSHTYDHNGKWAAQGTPKQELVAKWLKQDFFQQSPPKSTGRELFSQDYLEQCWQDLEQAQLHDSDLLATLTERTVASIVHSYRQFLPTMPDEVLLCGGGSRNLYLRQRLQAELTSAQIMTTDEVGIDGKFKEAIAFAVLAYWRINGIPGNLPQVTGAKQPTLLGDIHVP